MNKYALGTIVGASALSLLKSQGSKITLKEALVASVNFSVSFHGFDELQDIQEDDEDSLKLLEDHSDYWKDAFESIKKDLGYDVYVDFNVIYRGIVDADISFSKLFLNPKDLPSRVEIVKTFKSYIREFYDEHLMGDRDIAADMTLHLRTVLVDENTGEIYKPDHTITQAQLRKR